MKNDRKSKPMRVVLLDAAGNQFPGVHEVAAQGAAGFRLKGKMRMLTWADDGKTWERAKK